MRRIALVYPQGREKALTLSYDDGVDTDERFIGLLEKYGIKCTFNINSGTFSTEDAVRAEGQVHFRLSAGKAKALYNHPLCEVATHGCTHPYLDRLPTPLAVHEIVQDRRALEEMFGRIIRGHAYPYGTYNDAVVELLRGAGIAYARTTQAHHSFKIPEDWLRMGTTCHHGDEKLEELTDRFLNGDVRAQDGWLFYLWGHTYEFRAHDNWHVIERFFERVSGREDIWYATNIEVYDYVTAWRQLIYSADATRVYNPTATDLWIKADDSSIAVPAGKTIVL